MAKVRAHVFFDGRVQGVAFRAFTRDAARARGLTGWVRNLWDRRVEAVFEGEREAIELALIDCQTSHPFAVVAEMKVSWHEPPEDLTGFSIRY